MACWRRYATWVCLCLKCIACRPGRIPTRPQHKKEIIVFNRIIKSLIVLTGAALLVCACGPAPAPTTEVAPTDTPAPLPSATLETTMNAHWVFETEAAVWGSPSLNGDTIFIGSDDGNLYALEAPSGSLLW